MNWLQRQWTHWTPWHLVLLPLSFLFWLAASLRRWAFRVGLAKPVRIAVPVIVVGNIAVGGTGKTPLVIALVKMLQEQGFHPGIVSRGYKGDSKLPRPVTVESEPVQVGDEPVLLAVKTSVPVWVGQDRVAAAQALLGAHPETDIVVSDDGLQHYRLARDVEIVVVDAARWFGNGQLLPAGPLRESPRRLKQVDAVVINGWQRGAPLKRREFTMQLAGELLYNLRNPELKARPEVFAGQQLHAVAGIGNPQRFFQQLRRLGLKIVEHAFPDHHAFMPQDLPFGEGEPVVMTEKDAVKCIDFAGDNIWVLPVEAQLDAAFAPAILEKLRSLQHGSKTA
jgi:tetraacyldisaccharide 4'-kinase